MKSFDEKVENAYLRNKLTPMRASEDVRLLILNIRPEHAMLFGLRATVIKWDLLRRGRISRSVHGGAFCGVCYATTVRAPSGLVNCDECPAAVWCKNGARSARENHRIAFDLYMDEHRKFEQ